MCDVLTHDFCGPFTELDSSKGIRPVTDRQNDVEREKPGVRS